jgi:glycosyltransferase involved in cell wall biosynthesis
MKILCINYEYPPVGGGGATVCQSIAEALVRKGHEVDVVTSGMKDLPTEEVRNGVHIFRVKCIRRNRYYSTAPELLSQIWPSYRKALELIRTRNYDLNHTHFIVPSGIVSYLLKKKTGLSYVITAHGSDIPGYNPDRFKWVHRLIQPVWQKVLQESDMVISASHFLKGLIQEQIDCPVTVMSNAYDLAFHGTPDKSKRILIASRLVERKGVQFLIEASDVISDDWEVCIAGDGHYLPVLKRLAEKVKTPIRFLGFLEREELKKIYLSSSIFVFPSTQENFPMVLLEAMAAGCAIITTDIQGCNEVVGDAAIKVPPGNVEELRGALVKLTGDATAISHYDRLGRERVERYSPEQIAGQLENLFAQVINP